MGIIYGGKVYFPDYLINGKVVIIIGFVCYLFYVLRLLKIKKLNVLRMIIILFFTVYLVALIIVTLTPIFIFSPNNPVFKSGFGKEFIFNFSITDLSSDSRLQILGNLILLAPFVYFKALLYQKYSTYKSTLLLAFCISLLIETTHAIMNYFYVGNRLFDINDLILNTLGAIIGFGLYKITQIFFRKEIGLSQSL